jgi:hypothetical protein
MTSSTHPANQLDGPGRTQCPSEGQGPEQVGGYRSPACIDIQPQPLDLRITLQPCRSVMAGEVQLRVDRVVISE